MKRLREWVRARVDAVILPVVRRCVTEVVDYERLALHVTTVRGFSKEVSDALELDGEFVQRLAVEIDTSDIASNVEVDAEDVAEHLDYRRLAQALCEQLKCSR